MAWSSSTSGGSSFTVSHVIPSSSARSVQFIRSFTHHCVREIRSKVGLPCLMVVHRDEPSQLLHHLDPASFPNKPLRKTVTSLLLVCQELECADQVVAYSIWRSMRSEDFCFTAVRTICVTKILFGFLHSYLPPHAAHHQLHCFFFFFFLMSPCLDDDSVGCGPSLSFDWHNDPPQEVRALVQDLVAPCSSAHRPVAPLLCSTLAASRSSTRRACQHSTIPSSRPLVSCLKRLTHQGAIQPQVFTYSQELKLLLGW